MSSHKEAPGIANDPAADNTDVYAFVSPDAPDTVTLIANFVPLEDPDGGPNFFEFGEDVLYEIHIDNDGDGTPNVTYQFQFETKLRNEDTLLYNTGPIEKIDSKNFNRRQFYSVTKIVDGGAPEDLGQGYASPPCNIGPHSTPNYKENLALPAIHKLKGGGKVFAGQRAEGFYVDLGAIFDLLILRPFLEVHLAKMPAAPGVNSTLAKNVHSIAIQVPKIDLVAEGANPKDMKDTKNTIGVYASASRGPLTVFQDDGTRLSSGTPVQISRLGSPLVNEVLIPIPLKDRFNAQPPSGDKQFVDRFKKPEVAELLPVLYPDVFQNLANYKKDRADIVAIFLTGLPEGIFKKAPDFQNQVGSAKTKTQADLLRLNTAVPPAKKPSNLGLLGMDLAGFPNGRRVYDDVATIELRALAGATIPLVDPNYTPDKAATAITPGLTSNSTDLTAHNTEHYLPHFPYLGTPHNGYDHPTRSHRASDLGAINQAPDCPVPVGPPQTGIGPKADSHTGLLVGGGLALAGAVAAAGVATRSRPATAGAPAEAVRSRPKPGPARSNGAMAGVAERNEEPGE